MEKDGKSGKIRSSAASGAVAIIFLIIGFQAAVFVLKVLERPGSGGGVEAAALRADSLPVAQMIRDTSSVALSGAVVERASGPVRKRSALPGKRNLSGSSRGNPQKDKPRRSVESFRFDPNTVCVEDLVRLGLSPKQAECIGRYREKGGRFRKKEDFARMYVVSDSLYERLKDFIDIPRLELNSADSASLTSLKGIGPWYAAKIVRMREALGGFYTPLQLMEIRGIDSSRYAGLSEYVRVDTSLLVCIDVYSAPQESLAAHPYIGRAAAGAICRYRVMDGVDSITADVLVRENIIDCDAAEKLKHYLK